MDYKKVYKNVEKRYITVGILLVLLLVSRQIIIQYEINYGKDMSKIINVSGRQRMMSQKISKDILMIYDNNDQDTKDYYINDLSLSLKILESSHSDLIYGNKEEGLKLRNSDVIIQMFKEIDPYFNNILISGDNILNILKQKDYNKELFLEEIKVVIDNEKIFLQRMDEIVNQYDQQSKGTILLLEKTELILFFLIIISLGFITAFVFRPAVLTLRHAFIDINERNENILKLFHAMKGALFLVERNGDILLVNIDAQKRFNLDIKEDKDKNVLRDINWIDVDIDSIIEKAILGEKLDGIEAKMVDNTGDTFNMIISAISGKLNGNEVVLINAFDITSQKKAEDILKDKVIRDGLTGLYNRFFLESIIDSEIERLKRYDFPLSAVILDIDDFKKINDKWGHPVGDIVLKELASIVGRNLRESDYLIRIGGEEFVIIMPHTNLEDGYIVSEKLRMAIEDNHHDIVGQFTVSFGIAELGKLESYAELYDRMDQALYEAKRSGKNRVVKSVENKD